MSSKAKNHITIDISTQKLELLGPNQQLLKSYLISSAVKGVGEIKGSYQTPRGGHIIRAKIGAGALPNAVFVRRRWTGEIYKPELRVLSPERDWILTRILWLSGLEVGKNRLGNCDTMQRYVYIHGSPDDATMGVPGSKGCIRMSNSDIIELFDLVEPGIEVFIRE